MLRGNRIQIDARVVYSFAEGRREATIREQCPESDGGKSKVPDSSVSHTARQPLKDSSSDFSFAIFSRGRCGSLRVEPHDPSWYLFCRRIWSIAWYICGHSGVCLGWLLWPFSPGTIGIIVREMCRGVIQRLRDTQLNMIFLFYFF